GGGGEVRRRGGHSSTPYRGKRGRKGGGGAAQASKQDATCLSGMRDSLRSRASRFDSSSGRMSLARNRIPLSGTHPLSARSSSASSPPSSAVGDGGSPG